MSTRKKNSTKAQQDFGLKACGLLGMDSLRRSMPATGLLTCLWRWVSSRFSHEANGRRLRVTATAPLGEKRFVAVVKVDGREFLVGGGASNVTLLSSLDGESKTFSELLGQSTGAPFAHDAAPSKKRVARRTVEAAPVAKKKSSRIAAKTAGQKSAGRSVRMPRLSAQLSVAPALGHFIKPSLKKLPAKAKSKSNNRARK